MPLVKDGKFTLTQYTWVGMVDLCTTINDSIITYGWLINHVLFSELNICFFSLQQKLMDMEQGCASTRYDIYIPSNEFIFVNVIII